MKTIGRIGTDLTDRTTESEGARHRGLHQHIRRFAQDDRHFLIRLSPLQLMRRLATSLMLAAAPTIVVAQRPAKVFTRADTLRGSNGPGRAWWDAAFYDLHVVVSPGDSSISGYNAITYRVLNPAKE